MGKFELVPINKAKRKTGREGEYLTYIARVGPDQAGLLTPLEGESVQTIKRRLKSAAKPTGLELVVRDNEGLVYFWPLPRRGRPRQVLRDAID